MEIFGFVANLITVIAGALAIAGVIWAYLGRAKLGVTSHVGPGPMPTMTLTLTSVGANPVRSLQLSAGTLDENGFSMRGDGAGNRPSLERGQVMSVIGYEPAVTRFGSPEREDERRLPLEHGNGFYVTVQWQSPLFPWRRASRTYSWPPQRRVASEGALRLTGRKEIAFLERARDQSLNPHSPSFEPPQAVAARAISATDDTFDGLLTGHRGPVLVGFGPTWQGQWWEDVKRMLDAFAAKHMPKVRVLVVDVDRCPKLADRFDTKLLPNFKVFSKSEIVASHDGDLTLPALEDAFKAVL
ncbi:thioredoxin domain-containing protein [Microbacterium rhizomatis]|uniref:Thioredoxin domain-containing protein n=1 Tax=Microbacterium rhizomatis TaxID=1631477 RepID=A0A5J5J0K5_9MICO|nr:thioredoxin domain-containing protein [Microbacterium rhizomatis]KAA9108051.1 hypothetical protein F6B43_11590 [Microbacterium rhizomatis]